MKLKDKNCVTTDNKKDNMWNNRIYYNSDNNNYSVHETFYKDGEIWGFAEKPESGYFETMEELIDHHKIIFEDVQRYKDDVIDSKTLEKKFAENLKKEDVEIDNYKCFDFTLFELSSETIKIFEFFIIFREIYFNSSFLNFSLKPKFSIDELFFFKLKKKTKINI